MTSIQTYLIAVFCCAGLTVADQYAMADQNAVGARCDITADSGRADHPVQGTVLFRQNADSDETIIKIDLTGFISTDDVTKHGFHVHQFGDIGDSCKDAGGHYNPAVVNHGGPTAAVRHVGDLGNIEEDADGAVVVRLTDSMVSLRGNESVIGLAIVVHETEDDLGLGGNEGSRTTGNAGSRLGCCVIMTADADVISDSAPSVGAGLLLVLLNMAAVLMLS